MPIRVPRLDDRTYPDLVAELLARIPGHTPEYTNPVPGDPGHTLIELFAWLADTLLYRVNLIPERQRLEFLRMVGLPLRGARPAQGLVALRYRDLDNVGAAIEVNRLRPWCAVAGPVPFETRQPVTVLPVLGHVVHKRVLTAAEQSSVQPILSDLEELYELGSGLARPYVPTATFPADRARPQGFDVISETVDGMLWIALLAGREEQVAAARAALGGEGAEVAPTLHVGVVPAENWADSTDLTQGAGTARPLEVSWELTTGRSTSSGGPELVALEVVSDGTRGLTRQGVLELQLPPVGQIGRPENDVQVTVDAGVGPRPPRLDEPGMEARVVAWLRLRPKTGVDRLTLAWLGINAVPVDQRRTLRAVGLGVSSGAPDQVFPLPQGGVEVESFVLEVEEEGRGFVPWARADHLGLGGREDRIYELDPEEGTLRFGDGVRGRIPAEGRRISAQTLRAGGGPAGNLPPSSLTAITPLLARDGSPVLRPIEVLQPVPTFGGTAAESLQEAERRIPDVLRHRERAVTREDVVAVAASTPQVRLGRVEVIKGFKPHQRREDVPGVVSVMVLPRVDGWMPPAPRPQRQTLEAVHEWLSARMPLATELYVIGCEYKPIGLGIAYELRQDFDREATTQAITVAVRTMLWPLPPGGPFEEGTGWPRARAVRERELMVATARVPGVDEVHGISLFVLGEDGSWTRVAPGADGSAQITLTAWQLPELVRLSVVADADVPDSLDPSVGSGSYVAVPVVPELC
jgi:predicted phage baseplate assembly protein